jgi:choline dehydrogenase-like flavoprotein
MFADARELRDGATITGDVCVAGTGPAGITLALRLRDSGLRVVLLESGGLEHDAATQSLYDGEVTGADYPLSASRLRGFGGSGNHWAGFARPLDEHDFDQRPWLPHSGWPITRGDLDPYYEDAAELCELGSADFSPQGWAERTRTGLLPLPGGNVAHSMFQYSPPTHFGTVYRHAVEQATDIECYLHANLLELEPVRDGRRIRRARVATLDGRTLWVTAGTFVLALGGIENARLLLASTQGRPHGLGNDHDLVGRFFMEHPEGVVGTAVTAARLTDLGLYARPTPARHPTRAEAQPLTSALRRVTARLAGAPPRRPHGRVTVMVAPDVQDRERLVGACVFLEPLFGDRRRQASDETLEGAGALLGLGGRRWRSTFRLWMMAEQRPNPDSRVTLAASRDALGLPRVRLHWEVDPADHGSMRRSLELIAAELGAAGVGLVRSHLHRDTGALPALRGAAHHMGTTRMGDDPEHAVVDADCRVHGLDNLFVAGSSVFPTGGCASPTLTIVALAARLADHVREVA